MPSTALDIFAHYPGSKNVNGTWQTLINWMPPHDIYYEPFAGGGKVLREKKPAKVTICNDLDREVYQAWLGYDMEGLVLYNKPASLLLSTRTPGMGSLVYSDPPYPKGTRRSQYDLYNCEMTDQEHEEYLSLIVKHECYHMISTYENPMYSALLKDWNKHSFKSITRVGQATEVIYMNYDRPKQLHDYSQLGNGFVERQQIRRKIARKIKTLSQLPVLERMAILEALNLSLERQKLDLLG